MNKPLSAAQTLLFLGLGLLFWFVAALFIRFVGASVFVTGSPWLLVIFLAGLPMAWGLVRLSAVLGRIDGPALFPAVTLLSVVGLLLDGVAITWFPALYGLPAESLVLAAAWLLGGVGVLITVAYWLAYRSSTGEKI
jgi:hypothetical protein